MKIKIFIILLVLVNLIYPQGEPIEEVLKYYPLHIGDYWEYQVTQTGDAPHENWIEYKTVVGDTTLLNNKYFIIKTDTNSNCSMYKSIIRIDSSNGNVYQYDYDNYEFLIDSLLMSVGDTLSQQCFELSDQYMKEVFGVNSETRLYQQTCVTSSGGFTYELSKNFGEIHRNKSILNVTWVYQEYELIYAKINNIEFGVKTDVRKSYITPTQYSLTQNYPNPFNPSTSINYYLPERTFINLSVYDHLGRKVSVLEKGYKNRGNHSIDFIGSNLSSGVYYYILDFGASRISKKMLLIK